MFHNVFHCNKWPTLLYTFVRKYPNGPFSLRIHPNRVPVKLERYHHKTPIPRSPNGPIIWPENGPFYGRSSFNHSDRRHGQLHEHFVQGIYTLNQIVPRIGENYFVIILLIWNGPMVNKLVISIFKKTNCPFL